jgi:hypothetical protein
VLCCVVLRCVALRCVALRCVALRCVALCCVVLCCVVLCCVVLCCVVLCCVVLCCRTNVELQNYRIATATVAFSPNCILHIGVDTDAIIMIIAARSNKQRQEILQKYQSMYEKVIPVNL